MRRLLAIALDRRLLRCRGPGHAMREIDAAARVPGIGANDHLARFDPPAPLADLPCVRCHDDAMEMSLPREGWTVGARHRALLEQAGEASPRRPKRRLRRAVRRRRGIPGDPMP